MAIITVIIPVFNKVAYVGATLQSVLQQDFEDFEAILVNDGSTDGSREVLDQFSDSRISIIDQSNNGLSHARNTGIAAATTDLVALLDADDLWKGDHLRKIVNLAAQFPKAALFGTGYEEFFADGKRLKPALNLPKTSIKPLIISDFFEANMHQPLVVPSCFAFNREIINKIGGFDPKITYSEDVDFYIRASLNFKMAYDPAVSCSYRMDAKNQITSGKKSERITPNFQKYLEENPEHFSLKKYINLKRYFLAIFYKVEGKREQFNEIKEKIEPSLLSPKQRQLLAAPRRVVLALRFLKNRLLQKGKRITSF